jgi:hypothetical protein
VSDVDGEVLADLLRSVVWQLEVGSQFNVAARRLLIQVIQDDAPQAVRSMPIEAQDVQALSWIGSSLPVAWETAARFRLYC